LSMINEKRITIFAGHYGSGKTNLAVNYALSLREKHEYVTVCDVDTVNPYFRTKDSEWIFKEKGIKLVAPQVANSNLDIPSIPAETFSAFDDKRIYSVFDVGGDDSGAIALGQFADRISAADYEMLLVINRYRLLTSDPESLIQFKEEMEAASRLRFTGIANNPNLGVESDAGMLARSQEYNQKVSELAGMPIKLQCIISARGEPEGEIENYFPLTIFGKPNWYIQEENYGQGSH